jgi:hypothetical protein
MDGFYLLTPCSRRSAGIPVSGRIVSKPPERPARERSVTRTLAYAIVPLLAASVLAQAAGLPRGTRPADARVYFISPSKGQVVPPLASERIEVTVK